MIGGLDTKGRANAPESITAIAHAQVFARRMFVIALAAALAASIALLQTWTVTNRFQRESRITYVKLSPNGTWDVTNNMGESVEYFDATVRMVLYNWLVRRYSMRRATILEDWGIANAMYDSASQDWFVNQYRAHDVAAEHFKCGACDDKVLEVRTHQHLNELPRRLGEQDSPPLTTLFYATERAIPAGSLVARSETKKVFKVTWRFLSKAAIQSRPDFLRNNPIGVQILNVEVTDDPGK